MAEDEEGSYSRSRFNNNRGPDTSSPDSLIFTHDSNFSLFSSASVSVDRCSFTSDRDSLASEISLVLFIYSSFVTKSLQLTQLTFGISSVRSLNCVVWMRQLAGGSCGGGNEFHETSSRPDPNKMLATVQTKNHAHAHSRLFKKVEKAKLQKEDNNKATTIQLLEDHIISNHLIDSARNSFSLALRECQEKKCRSEAVSKVDKRRTASMDLNNVISAAAAESPRLSATKKSAVSSRKSGTFDSPVGTPHATAVGMEKGWNSERMALHNHSNNRRQQVNGNNASSLLHLSNNNGRTLPSKWEDAERWIFSPVSVDGGRRTSSQVPQRKPKSKSGPLGPPGIAYYSMYSPVFGGDMGSFIPAGSSPVSAGAIVADGLGIRSNGNNSVRTELCMPRSVSVHGFSETGGHTSSTSQDEKIDDIKNGATYFSCVSRRDIATQMSPEGSSSNNSSPSKGPSFSAIFPIVEMKSVNSSKSEVRDVQVDERVTVTRWSKKHRSRNRGKNSEIVDDSRKKSVDVKSSAWDVSEAAKIISKDKREEAQITAWENLQKAKAEAAIRKLEMKLEKKRSSSMDKIMNKLRSAQKKAQEMRSSVLANQGNQVPKTSHKAISFHRTRQMGSLSGCFTCHAF